jgi:hypothetical protein
MTAPNHRCRLAVTSIACTLGATVLSGNPARARARRPTPLWIRTPGESDGPCFCGLGGPEDPERGLVDPAAGLWLAEQARELIELAELALGGPSMRGPKH